MSSDSRGVLGWFFRLTCVFLRIDINHITCVYVLCYKNILLTVYRDINYLSWNVFLKRSTSENVKCVVFVKRMEIKIIYSWPVSDSQKHILWTMILNLGNKTKPYNFFILCSSIPWWATKSTPVPIPNRVSQQCVSVFTLNGTTSASLTTTHGLNIDLYT